jgi:prepilin-type N-terminal cleavage/methylation domain-containing protein
MHIEDNKMQRNTQNGFTLIELMIVVMIVGVLAAIAYPSYQDSVTKSRRADAKSALLELSVFMERLYTATGCYNPGADKICNTPGTSSSDDTAPTLPFNIAPKSAYILMLILAPSKQIMICQLLQQQAALL